MGFGSIGSAGSSVVTYVGAEQNNTPTADNAEQNGINGVRRYEFFTLPTTYEFYIITGIELTKSILILQAITRTFVLLLDPK